MTSWFVLKLLLYNMSSIFTLSTSPSHCSLKPHCVRFGNIKHSPCEKKTATTPQLCQQIQDFPKLSLKLPTYSNFKQNQLRNHCQNHRFMIFFKKSTAFGFDWGSVPRLAIITCQNLHRALFWLMSSPTWAPWSEKSNYTNIPAALCQVQFGL